MLVVRKMIHLVVHLRVHVEVWKMLHVVRWNAHIHWMRWHMSRIIRNRRTNMLMRNHWWLPDTRDKLAMVRVRWHVVTRTVRLYLVVWLMHSLTLQISFYRALIAVRRRLERAWSWLLHFWRWRNLRHMLQHMIIDWIHHLIGRLLILL